MDRNELLKKVQKQNKQLNKRFELLEEKGIGLNESAYRYSQAELGEDTPRFETKLSELKNLSNKELRDLDKSVNRKLISKSSTIRGVEEIQDKRISNAVYSLNKSLNLEGKKAITEKSFKAFINKGGGDLLNKSTLSSTQIVEDWLEYTRKGIKKQDFINLFNQYELKHTNKKGKVDYGKLRNEFDIELRNPNSIHVRKNKLAKVKKGKSTNVGKAYKKRK